MRDFNLIRHPDGWSAIAMILKWICGPILLIGSALSAQAPAETRLPPEIGEAYGRLGKAMLSHDIAGLKSVWAEDFIVNAPNNQVLHRDEVIAAMDNEFLEYRDFKKHIGLVSEKPDAVIVMGFDTMVPQNGPGAGRRIVRPFTDVWMRRSGNWMLIARQATITAIN